MHQWAGCLRQSRGVKQSWRSALYNTKKTESRLWSTALDGACWKHWRARHQVTECFFDGRKTWMIGQRALELQERHRPYRERGCAAQRTVQHALRGSPLIADIMSKSPLNRGRGGRPLLTVHEHGAADAAAFSTKQCSSCTRLQSVNWALRPSPSHSTYISGREHVTGQR